MKKIVLTTAWLLTVMAAQAQFIIGSVHERSEKIEIVVLTQASPERTMSAAAAAAIPAPGLPALPQLPAGTALEYVGEDATDYLVRMPGISSATFFFPKASAQKVVDPVSRFSMSGGVVTFPFKYRPKNGDKSATFEPSFSLSVVAGPSMKFTGTKDTYLRLLFGVGTSSITITSKNTDPLANITEETTRPAATFSSTLIFQTGKVQFAVSLGTDLNFDNSEDRWIYQGNPWLSAGIGFDIFQE